MDNAILEDDRSLSPAQFCELENIGHTKFYQEVNSGRLEAVKIGTSTRILPTARRKWRSNLPRYRPAA